MFLNPDPLNVLYVLFNLETLGFQNGIETIAYLSLVATGLTIKSKKYYIHFLAQQFEQWSKYDEAKYVNDHSFTPFKPKI